MTTGFKVLADGLSWIAKTAAENIDFALDWSARLLDGESIASSLWTLPTGITAGLATTSGPYATQWISGGTAGTTYWVANRITTSAGRTFERGFNLQIVERL
ncbi:MAG: hypothetical protein BroJett024_41260 [Alphaproteobacteria bacterium]|nr:MAG: hypothetical protein BroJett024_41260 [Alphaproteobacteria bacterium]